MNHPFRIKSGLDDAAYSTEFLNWHASGGETDNLLEKKTFVGLAEGHTACDTAE